MKRSGWLILAIMVAPSAARGESLTSSDGTVWERDKVSLVHGRMRVWFATHESAIPCASGIRSLGYSEPAFVVPGFVGVEVTRPGGMRSVLCHAGAPGQIVVTVLGPTSPTADEVAKTRSLVTHLGGLFDRFPKVEPEQLGILGLTIPLDQTTGVWGIEQEEHDGGVGIAMSWPLAGPVMALVRSKSAQTCSTLSLDAGRPDWAPSDFADLKRTRDVATSACFDVPDGRTLTAVSDTVMTADNRARVRALLGAITKRLAPTAPAPTTEPAPVETAEAATSDATPAAEPPPPADEPPTRSTRSYLHGVSISAHQITGDSVEDSLGGSIGYAHTFAGGELLVPRVAIEAGYNARSRGLVDMHLGLGLEKRVADLALAFYGGVGADAIGLGADAPMTTPAMPNFDRVYVPLDAYYGGAIRVDFASVSTEVGYFARNAEATDHEWRFELEYRFENAMRLFTRYRSFGGTGALLAFGIAL